MTLLSLSLAATIRERLFQQDTRQMDAPRFNHPYAQPLWRRGVRSCHQVTQCKLFLRISSRLNSRRVWSTKRRDRENHGQMYFWEIGPLLLAHRSVNSPPTLTQQITPTERRGVSDEAHALLWFFDGWVCMEYTTGARMLLQTLVCVRARPRCVIDSKKRGGVFSFPVAMSHNVPQLELLHLWMFLHRPKKNDYCAQRASAPKFLSTRWRTGSSLKGLKEPELTLDLL